MNLWPPGLVLKRPCSKGLTLIAPRLSVPGIQYVGNPLFVPASTQLILNAGRGASKAQRMRRGDIFASGRGKQAEQVAPSRLVRYGSGLSHRRNHFAASAFQNPRAPITAKSSGLTMHKSKARTAVLPGCAPHRMTSLLALLAIIALALAWLALPQLVHAQGIVRGAHEGAYEGNRVAGPVGGVVGGAVGAGVGGAVGAVEGVFGVPYRGWHHHCHGYRDGYGHFHCYR
jgi:hypothetical protein